MLSAEPIESEEPLTLKEFESKLESIDNPHYPFNDKFSKKFNTLVLFLFFKNSKKKKIVH